VSFFPLIIAALTSLIAQLAAVTALVVTGRASAALDAGVVLVPRAVTAAVLVLAVFAGVV
jgi:hypothetical protein